MPYKCQTCGNIQEYNGPCNGLMHPGGWYDGMMQMVNSNQRMANELNMAMYGDGGCCGCNTKRRRIFAFVLAIIAFLAAGVLALIDYDQYQENSLSCLVLGGICVMVGICCPDGCCGRYRRGGPAYYRV